jgi:hypothetical protein
VCMFGCGGNGLGKTPDQPLNIGGPDGELYHVEVITTLAGLWRGEAWLTGDAVPGYIQAGHFRLLPA